MVRSETFLEIHLFSPITSPLPIAHLLDNIAEETGVSELM